MHFHLIVCAQRNKIVGNTKKIYLLFCVIVDFHYLCKRNRKIVSTQDYPNLFSKNLFWDVDVSQLQMNTHAAYIIQRVMEYGQMEDWRLINRFYGLDRIVSECQQLRTLDPVCLSFLCTISHTKPEQYRCYHFRQSIQTPWNS